VAGLRRAFRAKQLAFYGECLPLANENAFAACLDSLFQEDWVVYAKPPFGGPEHVLHYLARYTHRAAISNHRILAVNQSQVIFRWKDYAHHNKQRTMPLTCEEFLHRFLQHVLPKGFPRIRYSAGLPIADETNCFRSVATCSHPWRNNPLRSLRPHFGYARVAMDQWLCLNDSPLYSFSTPKGGTNASLIVRRRRTPLAISADRSIHPLEVCPGTLKVLSLHIDDSLWPTSAHHRRLFSALSDLQYPRLSVALQHKNSIENT